jgi:hypothetical protein
MRTPFVFVPRPLSHNLVWVSLNTTASSPGMNPGVPLIDADGGKLRVRGCSFGGDEPSIAI